MSFNVKANSTTHSIDEYTVLFDGDSNSNITLSDSVANYKYVDIMFRQANNYKSGRVWAPNGKYVMLDMSDYESSQVEIFNALIGLSETTITRLRNANFKIKNSSTWSPYGYSTQLLYITKVIGYK